MNRITLKRPKMTTKTMLKFLSSERKYSSFLGYVIYDFENAKSSEILIHKFIINPENPRQMKTFLCDLSHEYMHYIIHKNINRQASVMLDGIDIDLRREITPV